MSFQKHLCSLTFRNQISQTMRDYFGSLVLQRMIQLGREARGSLSPLKSKGPQSPKLKFQSSLMLGHGGSQPQLQSFILSTVRVVPLTGQDFITALQTFGCAVCLHRACSPPHTSHRAARNAKCQFEELLLLCSQQKLFCHLHLHYKPGYCSCYNLYKQPVSVTPEEKNHHNEELIHAAL